MHLKHTTEDINLQRDYSKMETLRMNSEIQSVEPGLSKIRVLELESCVILMCEVCGETWSPNGSNPWVCPNGCNILKT
jgi:rubrerythrin